MSNNIKNIIPVENLDEYACKIEFYTHNHSHMGLSVVPIAMGQQGFHLEFSRVIYFSGSTTWKGANFQLASPSECLKILRQMSTFDNHSDESLVEEYKLFVSGTGRLEFKIIAVDLLFKDVNGEVKRLTE